MRIKGLYFHNEAQSRRVPKEEMVKTTGLVRVVVFCFVFFCPTHTICLSSCGQRGKVRKSPDGWVDGDGETRWTETPKHADLKAAIAIGDKLQK